MPRLTYEADDLNILDAYHVGESLGVSGPRTVKNVELLYITTTKEVNGRPAGFPCDMFGYLESPNGENPDDRYSVVSSRSDAISNYWAGVKKEKEYSHIKIKKVYAHLNNLSTIEAGLIEDYGDKYLDEILVFCKRKISVHDPVSGAESWPRTSLKDIVEIVGEEPELDGPAPDPVTGAESWPRTSLKDIVEIVGEEPELDGPAPDKQLKTNKKSK